jgi:hypothetical protein
VKTKTNAEENPAVGYRSPLQRAQQCAETLRKSNAKLQAEHNEYMAARNAEHVMAVEKLQAELRDKNKVLRTLRERLRAAGTMPNVTKRPNRKLLGGSTRQTRYKLAAQLESSLSSTFSTKARRQALLEHAQQHPTDYSSILSKGATLPAFEQICNEHPAWLLPYQQEVVNCIEREWSLPKCLAMQIHCKVGAQEKYQHLINLMSKNYNEETKTWAHKDVLPGIKMPKLRSKKPSEYTALWLLPALPESKPLSDLSSHITSSWAHHFF